MSDKNVRYAKGTDVPVARSRMEIEELLRKHGARDVIAAEARGRSVVVWEAEGRRFTMGAPLPSPDKFATVSRRANEPQWLEPKKRTEEQQRKAWEQACREHWRQLLLIIKARLVALEEGFESWESAFLRWLVLPDGRLLGDVLTPQVADAYRTGKMPPLLGAGTEP